LGPGADNNNNNNNNNNTIVINAVVEAEKGVRLVETKDGAPARAAAFTLFPPILMLSRGKV
jgi:hypothetical protein